MANDRLHTMMRCLLWLQGVYFAVTGVWPLVHMQSFLWVTGAKTDLWLVQTVGAVLGVIGVALCAAGTQWHVGVSNVVLAIGSAAALTAVDVVFTSERIIAPIYLMDALAECILLLGWVAIAGIAVQRRMRPQWQGHLAASWR